MDDLNLNAAMSIAMNTRAYHQLHLGKYHDVQRWLATRQQSGLRREQVAALDRACLIKNYWERRMERVGRLIIIGRLP